MTRKPRKHSQGPGERLLRALKRMLFPLNSCQQNAILAAAARGDGHELSHLLEGIDPNIRFSDATTLLTNVMISDMINASSRLEILTILHQHGADVNWPASDGTTPLMLATGTGEDTLCATLINLGASVKMYDRNGDTALIWAASTNALPSLTPLIDAGADVNHRGAHRRTPLMYAARNGAVHYLRELCNAGADPLAKDSEGNHPFALACALGKREAALFLIERVPEPYAEISLLLAASVGLEQLLERALDRGADPFERNEHKLCALDLAIMYSRNSAFKRLLPLYVTRPDALNQSLGCAVLADSLEHTRALLDAGADPNGADEIGDTPLIHAARKNSVAISEVLLSRGANPLQKNHAGDDSIDVAQQCSSSEAFQVLARAARGAGL